MGMAIKSDNPLKIEQDLLNVADKKHWQNLNLILVSHGREFCKAKFRVFRLYKHENCI